MNAYGISCSTGCSCCSNENHLRGPYKTLEYAQSQVEHFKKNKLLSSQYSTTGNYSIFEIANIEELPDGRLIIGRTVFDGFAEDTYDDEMPGDTYDYDYTYIKS